MPRVLGILVLLPLTFALMPLAVLVMGSEGSAPGTTLVLEPAEGLQRDAGGNTAYAVPFDADEFGRGENALAYRSADGGAFPKDACSEAPQG